MDARIVPKSESAEIMTMLDETSAKRGQRFWSIRNLTRDGKRQLPFPDPSAVKRSDLATSSASRHGRSSRISWTDMPSATMATTVAVGTRSPPRHGAPPITVVSTVSG